MTKSNTYLLVFMLALIFLLFTKYYRFGDSFKSQRTEISERQVISAKSSQLPVSLEKIFDGVFEYNPESMLQITITGDLMPGRMINVNSQESRNYLWAYERIKDRLGAFENIFVNLESPIIENCQASRGGMIFCSNPSAGEALRDSNIKFVSLANNHILNYGLSGLNETKKTLGNNKISYTGVNNPTYFTDKGFKVALLGFDDVECNSKYIECANEINIVEDIRYAKENADLVLVMFHWGNEYTYFPTQRQKKMAHMSIDSGADVVVGNHPHWYQSAEIYDDKLIVYSHGNFIFDQMWSRNTREGIVGKYAFDKAGLIDATFIPTYISNYGQVEIASGEIASKILSNFKKISTK